MRAAGRVGRTVVLRLRFSDYSRATRSHTLVRETAATRTVLATARGLLAASQSLIEQRGITLLGIAVSNLDSEGGVMELPPPVGSLDGRTLDEVLDHVRDRYGAEAITRATLLGRGQRLSTWLFPDEASADGP
jgi:DNA polymerase-4